MIRIVGVQRSDRLEEEFVILQNQGHLRVSLRGHALLNDAALDGFGPNTFSHVFSEDEMIGPGQFVLVRTGSGSPRWGVCQSGSRVYYTFMGLPDRVWSRSSGAIHVMSLQHSYSEPKGEYIAV